MERSMASSFKNTIVTPTSSLYDDVRTCHIVVKKHLLNLPYSFNRIYFERRALQQPARARGGRATCYVPIICHVARYDTLKAHIRGGRFFDTRNAFQYNSIFFAPVLTICE